MGVTPKYDHSVSKGKLCVKGWQGYSFVKHQDRLKKPLIKNAAGEFQEASWDEAYTHIVQGLQDIKAKHGSDSIGVLSSARCTNEENYLLTKFARAILNTNHIDHCARL